MESLRNRYVECLNFFSYVRAWRYVIYGYLQNQYGTKTKLIATPASRVAALNNVSNNMAKTGDVRLRVAAGLRDTAQVTSTYNIESIDELTVQNLWRFLPCISEC